MPVHPLELPPAPTNEAFQRFLFSPETMSEITDDPKNGQYTAENCPDQLKELIVFLLAADWSDNEIRKQLHVHHRTVARIRDENQSRIGDQRAMLVRRLKQAGRYQVDRLVDNPGSVPMPYAAKTARDLIELAELLDGRATARVEHVEPVSLTDDWDEFIEKQLEPGRDVIELPSGTGLVGEKKNLIGNGAVDERAAKQTGLPALTKAETDLESDDRARAHQENGGPAMAAATIKGMGSGRPDGGGGVASSTGAGQPGTDKSTQEILANGGPS